MTLATAGVPAISQSASITNLANGQYTGDASGAVNVFVGFTPRRVKVVNMTDAITWEFIEGMAATNTLKTAANGTLSVDTTSAIVTNGTIVTVATVGIQGQPGGDTTQAVEDNTVPPGDSVGVIGGFIVNVTEESPNKALPQLTFGGTSALNISGKLYVWFAAG